MYFANIKNCDIANGPGVRVSLFVSGCDTHCPECFNKVAWDFAYGYEFDEAAQKHLLDLLKPDYINGLTILGGEPLHPRNSGAVAAFVNRVRNTLPDKSIWLYTGYTYEYVLSGNIGDCTELLNCIDVIVDGPFIAEKKNLGLRFCGSENQRIIDVKKTLETGSVCLWSDWQNEGHCLRDMTMGSQHNR